MLFLVTLKPDQHRHSGKPTTGGLSGIPWFGGRNKGIQAFISVFCEDTDHGGGDFLVDGTYTFEMGERNKDMSQISGVDNAFLALDDIESGIGSRIPLWLLGFLY